MKLARKKSGIIKESLENVSRNLFKNHMEIITELIGDSSTIYALYDENELPAFVGVPHQQNFCNHFLVGEELQQGCGNFNGFL